MAPRIVAIGNIVADLIAPSVKKIPKWGQLVETSSISLSIGGNAAIFAACSARLGIRSGVIGKVGRDALGSFLVKELNRMGVDTSRLKIEPRSSTSVTFALSNTRGERLFIHNFGANATFAEEDVDMDYVYGCKLLHVCAYNLVPLLVGEPTLRIMKKAKTSGLVTTFDVSWDPKGRWDVDGILEYTDVFLPNESEARHITGARNPSLAADRLVDMGADIVAIKLGRRGCLVRTQDREFLCSGFKVPAVDTTGAGDAFNAGFVYGLLKKWDLEKTANFANAVAALTVTKPGGTTAAPTLAEAEEFLRRRGRP